MPIPMTATADRSRALKTTFPRSTTESNEALINVQEIRPVLEQIANKWSVLILTVLCSRPSRFNEIMRRLEGITHKALADSLKRLERNGLISRKVLAHTTPIGVEYSITPMGESLKGPFSALYEWATEHGATLQRAQLQYDERE